MFRAAITLLTLFITTVLVFIYHYKRYLQSYPKEIADPLFIGFGITAACAVVYAMARYCCRRPKNTWKAMVVLFVEIVVVPLCANFVWCRHLQQTIVSEMQRRTRDFHDPYKLIFEMQVPAFVLIALAIVVISYIGVWLGKLCEKSIPRKTAQAKTSGHQEQQKQMEEGTTTENLGQLPV